MTYPDKSKNKRKNEATRRNPRLILIGALLLGVALVLFVYLYPTLFTPTINLSGVQSVQILDVWTGLSPVAPVKSDYTLTIQDGALVGEAVFSITYDEPITDSVDIEILVEAVTDFIASLENIQLKPGPYHPTIEWTDDYPSIEMVFQTDHGEVVIFTGSQGEFHVPWGAKIDGETYVIDSPIPMEALNSISPYLHQDKLEALIDGFYSSGD